LYSTLYTHTHRHTHTRNGDIYIYIERERERERVYYTHTHTHTHTHTCFMTRVHTPGELGVYMSMGHICVMRTTPLVDKDTLMSPVCQVHAHPFLESLDVK